MRRARPVALRERRQRQAAHRKVGHAGFAGERHCVSGRRGGAGDRHERLEVPGTTGEREQDPHGSGR
jgi:hypothetical protein